MPFTGKGGVSEMTLYWSRSTEGCVVGDHDDGTKNGLGLELRNEPGRRDGLESARVGDALPACYRSSPAIEVQARREDVDVAACRPIVVLFGWMMSKRVHTTKYAQLYNRSGWDTLTCHPPTLYMWLPSRALHLAIQVLDELVKELQGRLRPIVLATFSGGSKACHYKLLQVLLGNVHDGHIKKDAYSHIHRCAVGQIFDSSPIDHVSSLGVRFLSRRPGQPASPVRTAAAWGAAKLLDFFMLSESERQRSELRQTQVASAVIGPMLVIYSKDDDLAPAEYIEKFIGDVIASGGRVYSLCWEKSEHVGHLRLHPTEYSATVSAFLSSCLMMSRSEKHQVFSDLLSPAHLWKSRKFADSQPTSFLTTCKEFPARSTIHGSNREYIDESDTLFMWATMQSPAEYIPANVIHCKSTGLPPNAVGAEGAPCEGTDDMKPDMEQAKSQSPIQEGAERDVGSEGEGGASGVHPGNAKAENSTAEQSSISPQSPPVAAANRTQPVPANGGNTAKAAASFSGHTAPFQTSKL